ncbi:GGDEF domain-containing protein [Glaciibacter sp. 2TAF33]|uniref:GGDEF domain-containing protein n=1 Tax=Glaciibacter sp. 2TAF33 TaxID=3233015 RepID=UPI003F93C503
MDTVTLLVVSGLVISLCGAAFVLNTSFNGGDRAGRAWSLAFIGGMMSTLAFAVYGLSPSLWGALVVANATLTLALGSMWSGSRLYNGRAPLFWVVSAASVAVAVAVIVRGPGAGGWAGAFELYLAVAAFAAAGSFEAMRRRLTRNINGRIIVVIEAIVAAYYAGRALAFLLDGPTGEVFVLFFGTAQTAVLNMVLVVLVAGAMSVLRAEQHNAAAVGDRGTGVRSAAGVLSAAAFAQVAGDHLERAAYGECDLALVAVDIDRLPELNTAFGRAAGDGAIESFAQTLRRTAPVMATIGHVGGSRFLVLAPVGAAAGSSAPSAAEAVRIAERIQTGLVDEPLAASQAIRLTASFGVADTTGHGYDLPALTAAVARSVEAVKAAGGNDVHVARPEVSVSRDES